MKIKANGIQINVREQSAGEPALVFLHYYGGSSRTWDGVISRLKSKVRSIALDHRGYGESDAPREGYRITDLANDAQAVIEALGLKSFVLVGHSMGGKTAQLLASRQPKGLKGLVLVAPSPAHSSDLGDELRHTIATAYDTVQAAIFTRDNVLTARPLSEALKAQVLKDNARSAPQARIAWPNVALLEDYSAELGKINTPTLVISGTEDKIDPVDVIREKVVRGIPNAHLKVLEGVGHLSPLEAPAELASLIDQFVTEIA
jgi:3-oxoadipate enol-lactonase